MVNSPENSRHLHYESGLAGGTDYWECGWCRGVFTTRVSRSGMGSSIRLRPSQLPRRVEQALRSRRCVCIRPAFGRSEGHYSPPIQRRPLDKKAPQSASTSPVPAQDGKVADLEALTRLWKAGALTDEEFNAVKSRLLITEPAASVTQEAPVAGWYRDPNRPDLQRYWDGSKWTQHTVPAPPAPGEAPRTAESSKPLSIGDRVTHPAFGDGVVLAISGAGAQAEVTVSFEGSGRKHLSLAWAPLTRIET